MDVSMKLAHRNGGEISYNCGKGSPTCGSLCDSEVHSSNTEMYNTENGLKTSDWLKCSTTVHGGVVCQYETGVGEKSTVFRSAADSTIIFKSEADATEKPCVSSAKSGHGGRTNMPNTSNGNALVSESSTGIDEKPSKCSMTADGSSTDFSGVGTKCDVSVDTAVISQSGSGVGEELNKCSVCEFCCHDTDVFRMHMLSCHKLEELKLPYCIVCKKAFADNEDPLKHLQKHKTADGQLMYCKTCCKLFLDRRYYNRHMLRHSGQRRHQCSDCLKAFDHKGDLRKHMRKHSGEKPFKCAICQKAFSQLANLHTHVKTHTGEQSFTCSFCGKAFTQKYHRNRHLRIHTGELPFKCHICGKEFSRRDYCKIHVKAHGKCEVLVPPADDQD